MGKTQMNKKHTNTANIEPENQNTAAKVETCGYLTARHTWHGLVIFRAECFPVDII